MTTDPHHIIGNGMALAPLLAYWLGILPPVLAGIASCLAIAWYSVLFLDRRRKNGKS
jgi:tellurite resistance protein TehA-like permease